MQQDHKDQQAHRELQDILVLKVQGELLVRKAIQELQDTRGLKGPQDP